MEVLYDTYGKMRQEVEALKSEIRGRRVCGGIAVLGEINISNRDITVVPPRSYNYSLIKGVCDNEYDNKDIFFGKDEPVKERGTYSERSIKGMSKDEKEKRMFPGNMFLHLKYNLSGYDSALLHQIIGALERRMDQTLIIANCDLNSLRNIRNCVNRVKIAATSTQLSKNNTSISEVDYMFYDFTEKERFRDAELFNKHSNLETSIFDGMISEDDISKIVAETFDRKFEIFDIIQKRQRGRLTTEEMMNLIDLIAEKKIIQIEGNLRQGIKTIVILSEAYEPYFYKLRELDKNDDLIVSTSNPVLIKAKEIA